jgi:hypothetical protein
MKKTSIALAALTSLGLALPAAAEGLNYNFIDARYFDGEVVDGAADADGFGISGQALINPNFYVLASYSTLGVDNSSVDIETIRAGLGYRHALAPATDLNAEVLFLNVDADFDDDSGFELGLGLRHSFTEVFEGKVGVRHQDVFDGDDTFFEVGALAHLTPQLSAGIDYISGDLFDGFTVGGRFNF